jgi:single-strand DNA-binding protein
MSSASVNKVILVGNLGSDPELKYTPSNRPLCNISLATNEVFKDKAGARQERTEWHRVTVWGEQAETCSKYLNKGRSVYVEGRLQTRSWDDKEGKKRYSTDIVADRVVFLGAGNGGGAGRKNENDPRDSAAAPDLGAAPSPGDDDVPF